MPDIIDVYNRISQVVQTIEDIRTFQDYQEKFMVNEANDKSLLLAKINSAIQDRIGQAVGETISGVKALTEQVNLNTNLQAERIVQTVTSQNAALSGQITYAVNQLNTKLDNIQSSIENLAEKLALQMRELVDKMIQEMGRVIDAMVEQLGTILDKFTSEISKTNKLLTEALTRYSDVTERGLDNIAQAIDATGLFIADKAMQGVQKQIESQEQIAKTMHGDLSRIVDSISTAGALIALGEGTAALTTSQAFLAGCTAIATAITGAQAANKLMLAPKLVKDLAIADKLLTLLTAIGGVLALDSPEALAEMLAPIIDAYYNVGHASTIRIKE